MKEFTFSANASSDQISEAYLTYGVVVVRNCIPEHIVSSVSAFLSEYLVQIEEFVRSMGVLGPLIDAGPQIQVLLQTSKNLTFEHRHQLLGHYPLKVRLSDNLKRIPDAIARYEFIQAIHKSKYLFAHMPLNARWVLPNQTYAAVPAHQDSQYNSHMRDFSVVWTPLCQIDHKCGGMVFYPRKGNKNKINTIIGDFKGDWLPELKVDSPPTVISPLSPGDAVVFDSHVVHASVPNTSSRIRLNVEARIFGDPKLTTKPYLDLNAGKVFSH